MIKLTQEREIAPFVWCIPTGSAMKTPAASLRFLMVVSAANVASDLDA
jgi:hypothetical protein